MANEKCNSSACSNWSLGVISDKFEKHIKKLGVEIATDVIQKIALLGSARILRKVLSL